MNVEEFEAWQNDPDGWFARIAHDECCELRPGGEYHGRLLSDGLPIPCHCVGRAEGRAKAEREIARANRRVIRDLKAEFGIESNESKPTE